MKLLEGGIKTRELEDYLALVPWQHRNQPKFIQTLTMRLEPWVHIQALIEEFRLQRFDLDTANGVYLEWLADWVGVSRGIPAPIEGQYLTWYDDSNIYDPAKVTVGWGYKASPSTNENVGAVPAPSGHEDLNGLGPGRWFQFGDPTDQINQLDDVTLRALIKAKILANSWQGDLDGLYTIIETFLGLENQTAANNAVTILDGYALDADGAPISQKMSFVVMVDPAYTTDAQRRSLEAGVLPIKPYGVSVFWRFAAY